MNHSTPAPSLRKITVPSLRQFKRQGDKISMLTCYDAAFADSLDRAGVDIILVGDSLGMVVQGRADTLAVSVSDMVYHAAAVRRGTTRPLLLVDMPFQSYANEQRALDAAHRLVAEGGAEMVKLEGAGPVLDAITYLAQREIPVCGHLGLTPQSVNRLGGFKVQGKEQSAAERLVEDAKRVQQAGAELLVLECVPAGLAKRITSELDIPTIGIGAGSECDGQVLVLHDLLGVTPGNRPRFVKDFLAEGGSVQGAVRAFVEAVRDGAFPAAEHSY
ncbi:3-methyl-2-oxobutanoate hydroxymethyltransferase [Pseudomarimonas arenosa]|uniref:3-methyl-2-oxobutanoate hydroxymethyltransferase n=1 Tax=Pseudomarimonas arenosa TaxID=2774145 RepID=A0AAW3ZKB8_9GAMM|nr:3-methyl-2-oxobutanoate hydroxymethyltransferase [Pseudomarimonas arenosa]MBD8526530.1 3-methyl-2-oxobutanoate hydroxymethyltransferase [Pseudomarimonas arenosa]